MATLKATKYAEEADGEATDVVGVFDVFVVLALTTLAEVLVNCPPVVASLDELKVTPAGIKFSLQTN